MNGRWLVRLGWKLLRLLSLLAAVCFFSFWLVHLSPIDPVQAYIGADMMLVGPEQRQQIEAYWGLDRPPLEQFGRWLASLLHGDFGTSMIYRQPVLDVIAERFWSSFLLLAAAWVLSGIIGFAAGILAAMTRDRWPDRLISWYCYTLAATPTYWLGLVLLLIFSVWLEWFPIGLGVPAGVQAEYVTWQDRLHHMVLPAMALSITGIAPIALHTRQKLLDVLNSEFVLFAKARGFKGWRLLRRHGLRNIALPAISLQFAAFSELFGGTVLVEQVFSYPGLGQALVEAGLRGDVPLLLGLVLFSTLFVYVGNGLADGLYRWIDPRIRKGSAA